MSIVKTVEIGGKKIEFEFNKFAKQANSVMVSCGDTQVLVSVTAADKAKPEQDFFPLTVDYIEKFYSAGKIPGGFLKRESKPTDREILTSRVIDRPLRPSFPENYLCETFVTAFVVSYDNKNSPAPLALLGASTALMISDVPFNGPVAAVRLGMDAEGNYVYDPGEKESSDLDLNIAANPNAILMVEAGANFLTEDKMIDALNYAHNLMKPLFQMQLEIQKEIGVPKRVLASNEPDAALKSAVESASRAAIAEAFAIKDKAERGEAMSALNSKIFEAHNPDGDGVKKIAINNILENLKSNIMRDMILTEGRRIDGRGLSDIRKISCEVGVLRRPHGSALFTRGETQALGIVTLGGMDDSQRMDSVMSSDYRKRFLLHYNFPPFSVGEARPLRPPGRREIGHGMLAERALSRVMPDEKDFGYTVRYVSEVLESNGSSSMATVCAGTMAMLHAGVPLKEPVAGIAMGLIFESNKKFAVLSDILGDEDHLGDMDFKVCGSERGISALQMDIKVKEGLPTEVLAKALAQAKEGRKFILQKVTDCIKTPGELSQYAPRIFQIKIKQDRIRDLIGPGGKTIKKITAETGVKIDIDDSGIVNIVSPDTESAEAAKNMIRNYTSDPEVGAIYLGTVKKIMDFGCFVEIKPGTEGLVHISQLEDRRVNNIYDLYKEGEEMMVKVLELDSSGRIKLSRKDALGKKPTA
jgi:polyribonucleotide nucleotidyltransferase